MILLLPTTTVSETLLEKVHVLEAESHVPIELQSPPVESSEMVISANASFIGIENRMGTSNKMR